MKQLFRRIASIAVTGALAIGSLAACTNANTSTTPTYESAADLSAAATKAMEGTSYHMDSEASISMESANLTYSMPVTVKSDVVGTDSHHVAKLSINGEEMTTEIYVLKEGDKYVSYTGTESNGKMSWTKSAMNTTNESTFKIEDLVSKGEFAKTNDGYTITITGEAIMNSLATAIGTDASSIDQLIEQSFSFAGDSKKIVQSVKDSKAVFTFNKDAQLTNVDYPLTISFEQTSGSDSYKMDVKISVKIAISNYGQVDASSVKMPEAEKAEADKVYAENEATAAEITDLLNTFSGDSTQQNTGTQQTGTAQKSAA